MWMHFGERKNCIVFGGGQRSSGVTRGQTLKTLFTRYLKMCYGERKNPIFFGGGQRSSVVTGGQSLKTLCARYLKVGSFGRSHA
ncbi:hypothetical protein HOLleu_07397 [Holothuria leucospilota]|uniref:Uncharacterized protein n=1 Tax=Holothuria leucospilota TaxID=206669 RepID=A0A9Q1HGY7_HOLLE|nr:hypothetical protein HOLleu_07397 [Holothuria leucospilota]